MAVKQTNRKRRVGDGTPGPGRPKGSHNKFTVEVRDMVLAALNGVGGVAYLEASAKENPTAFLALVGKLMPRPVELSGAVATHATVTRVVLVPGQREDADNGQ